MGRNPPLSLAFEDLVMNARQRHADGGSRMASAQNYEIPGPDAGPEASPRPPAGLGGALHPLLGGTSKHPQAAPPSRASFLTTSPPLPQSLGQVSAVLGQGHTALAAVLRPPVPNFMTLLPQGRPVGVEPKSPEVQGASQQIGWVPGQKHCRWLPGG